MCKRPKVSKTQGAIQALAAELSQVDRRLAAVSEGLPEPADDFDMPAELRSAVDCVRNDLLADAISTLNHIATASERGLRQSFEERQKWLVAAVV